MRALEQILLTNSLADWLGAVGIALGLFVAIWILKRIVTTRVRSLSGEQIVFSNADLLNSRIRNYKRMHERRVPFTSGVVYQTPPYQLAAIPQLARACIEAQAKTRFDRAHFKEYGDSALVFEAVYFVLDADYNVYMDIHQAVQLALFRRLRERGIEFAYPTRTLHVSQVTSVPASNPGANS